MAGGNAGKGSGTTVQDRKSGEVNRTAEDVLGRWALRESEVASHDINYLAEKALRRICHAAARRLDSLD